MKYAALFSAIATSEKMADLSDDSHRLFYLMLLPQADSWGRITGRPRKLNAKVWPLLDHDCAETTAAMLDCISCGLLEYYGGGEEPFIQVPDWEEKAGSIGRKDRRGASKFPDPTGSPTTPDSTTEGKIRQSLDIPLPDQSRTKPDRSALEEKRGRGKKEEVEGDVDEGAFYTPSDVSKFAAWWCAEYERTQGTPYDFTKKDGALARGMLRTFRWHTLKERAETFLTTTADAWINTTDRSIGVLKTCINKPAVRGVDVKPATSNQATLKRAAKRIENGG